MSALDLVSAAPRPSAVVLDLTGRTALVTGAAGGIGRACALRLAAAGARVRAVDRAAEGLETLTAQAEGLPGSLEPRLLDLTDLDAAEAAAAGADILVNNAGIQLVRPIEEFPPDVFHTVLTNPGLGSLGSSLTAQINQRAAHQASLTIGKQLSATTDLATTRLLLTDPVAVTTEVGHPIGRHSGLGLTAFYYTLLLVLGGFIGGNLVNSGVDTALGYADSEIGPWHSRHPTVPISRTQTLILKMLMTAGISVLTTTLVMVATIAILGMDASHLPMLWIFSYCATVAVGLGVQAINAAFGGIGQLVSMFVFIALALPSSGATVPLEATPGFYRFLGVFEPMHQLSSGVRSILYFDARADAGLARGWIMIAVGVALALAFGLAMTHYYDRRGLRRLTPQPA